jgi:hypothetical protein
MSNQPDAETSTWQHKTLKWETSMPQAGFFFFCLSGVFPLWSIFVLFKFFRPSCHFTFHATVLTTNTKQTSMPPVGFESTNPVSERPLTHDLDSAATGIGHFLTLPSTNHSVSCLSCVLKYLQHTTDRPASWCLNRWTVFKKIRFLT